VFGPLAATATSYSDPSGPTSAVLCYILLPVGTTGLLGVSDLLCAQNSVDQGTVVAGAFTLSMNQSATSTLTWEAPAGGADSYVLGTLPLVGGAAGSVALPGTATSTTHATGGAPYCYLLFGAKGGAFGVTDMLCGVPGISTLVAVTGGRLTSVEDAVAAVTDGLAGITLPTPEAWRAGGVPGQ
jgi:hypothetical protein